MFSMPNSTINRNPSFLFTWPLTGKRGRKANEYKSSSEEHDTAHFLLLLSSAVDSTNISQSHNELSPVSSVETHRCNICSRSFSSPQALGGHRASHAKMKLRSSLTPATVVIDSSEDDDVADIEDHSEFRGKKHECSICFKKFSSGQALGGHKRCHWEGKNDRVLRKKKVGYLGFDLNLPPPPEDSGDFYINDSSPSSPSLPSSPFIYR